MWDWIDHSKKNVLVETKSFNYGLQLRSRPTCVASMIHVKTTPRQAAKNLGLSFNRGSNFDGRPLNIEGGHVIGIKIGGVDDLENIVPMYSHVNRGSFATLEREILNKYIAGKSMGVIVILDYTLSTDARIPFSITVKMFSGLQIDEQRLGCFAGRQEFSRTIQNTPQQAARKDIDPHVAAFLNEVRQNMPVGWKIEDQVGETANWVSENKLPPVNNRPYALLDWIYLNCPDNEHMNMSREVGTMGPGRTFSPRQRQLIEMVNRYSQPDPKKGECWSDVGNDPHQSALIQLGTDTGIEVDHIMPMRPVGSNTFSNAQITSAGYNRSKAGTT